MSGFVNRADGLIAPTSDQGDGSNDHLIDTRPAFLSALSWHIIRHWLSSAKITIPFHFTKAFAEK